MKLAWSLIALLLATGAAEPSARIGLKCIGNTVDPNTNVPFANSKMTSHYVLDIRSKSIYDKDPVSGKMTRSYDLKIDKQTYSGESQSDALVNGFLNEHHYDTIFFNRTDGRVEWHSHTAISPQDQPNKLTFNDLAWIGHCEREAADHREVLKF